MTQAVLEEHGSRKTRPYSDRELRKQVSDWLTAYGDDFIGLTVFGNSSDEDVLNASIEDAEPRFIFRCIARALTELGEPGDFRTVGDVIKGLRYRTDIRACMALAAVTIGSPVQNGRIPCAKAAARLV